MHNLKWPTIPSLIMLAFDVHFCARLISCGYRFHFIYELVEGMTILEHTSITGSLR